MKKWLCRVRHKWTTTSTESTRYGVLITDRCSRCGDTRLQVGFRL